MMIFTLGVILYVLTASRNSAALQTTKAKSPASAPACSFQAFLSKSAVTIPCGLKPGKPIGISVQGHCGQNPLKSCTFKVYQANGTNPSDKIGGAGDTYESKDYGPCAFVDNKNSTKACPKNTRNSVNRPFRHVLTTNYVQLDPKSSDLRLASQELVFDPPNPTPFMFVPSPDGEKDVINQFYRMSCVDSSGRTSDAAEFKVTYPFCP